MEKFIFKKVEMWVVLLVLLFVCIGAIFFGSLVREGAKDKGRFGAISDTAYFVASIPELVKDALTHSDDNWMSVADNARFPGRVGWDFDRTSPAARPDGYVLLSRYDGDPNRHVLELVDLKSGTTEHRLVLRPEDILAGWKPKQENDIATAWVPQRFRAIHPYVFPNGDFMVKDHHSPLMRLTACGDVVWRNEEVDAHHSLSLAPDGTFWVPDRLPVSSYGGVADGFSNPAASRVDAYGNVISRRSIGDLFVKHGLEHLLFDEADLNLNPMHLNDIEPVWSDGPHWKRGDVFLSLRASSTIMQYRPETDEIIWMRQGPWRAQHDVDIVNDHTIAIFDNNALNKGKGVQVLGHNQVSFYDFETDKVSGPFDEALAAADVRTPFGGLFELLPDGSLLAEETTNGRLVILERDGRVLAEFVNRASDGKIYFMGWSRFLTRADGDQIRDVMQAAGCEADTGRSDS
ncbi:arylsulfotransferase family protein [Ruegeria sp. HKCCA6837]|uniref:arylsulfotransferase family protein n=1 Tax=Ruegeria sp. HKCCA6837 TaxID=2682989 RepID=UPI001489824E|nr:arylsulfotransferase family protein [Ruegeria sp. HKCCA6837]